MGPWTGSQRQKNQLIARLQRQVRNTTNAGENMIANYLAAEFFAGVEQMMLHEQSGGDGWWKGWEVLKATYQRTEKANCTFCAGYGVHREKSCGFCSGNGTLAAQLRHAAETLE